VFLGESSCVSTMGHPDGVLVAAIDALKRSPNTSRSSEAHSLVFQLNKIDYVTQSGLSEGRDHALSMTMLPRWTRELETRSMLLIPVEVPVVRMFGCTEDGGSVEVRVHGFEPYLFCRLPDGISDAMLPSLQHIRSRLDAAVCREMRSFGSRSPYGRDSRDTSCVVRVERVMRTPLKGFWDDSIPFLRITTAMPKHVRKLREVLERPDSCADGMPACICYEADVDFALRFMIDTGITGCDWIRVALPQTTTLHLPIRGSALDLENGGYCARRDEAEAEIRRLRAAWNDCDQIDHEEAACERIWPADLGDPFGWVDERTVAPFRGRCVSPWSCERDDEGNDLRVRYVDTRDAVPRFPVESLKTARSGTILDVTFDAVSFVGTEGQWAKHAPLRILSFDTEWIGKGKLFPESGADPLTTICFATMIGGRDTVDVRVALQLGECASIPNCHTIWFDDERTLLMAFRDLFVAYDPDIVTGYNTNNFDWPWLVARAKTLRIEKRFCDLSRVVGEGLRHRRSEGASFASKAMVRSVDEVAITGVSVYDMNVAISCAHKLPSYKLNAVARHFLGEQKLEVGYEDLPILQRGGPLDRRMMALYCLRDAELPLMLMARLKELQSATEMARVTRVPMDFLLTRGQQTKVAALLFPICRRQGIVVDCARERDAFDLQTKYKGATVLKALRGFYDVPIATLDFESLYPSIIMAHNLCFITYVTAQQRSKMHEDHYEIVSIDDDDDRGAESIAFVRAPKTFSETRLSELCLEKDKHYVLRPDGKAQLVTPGRIARSVALALDLREGPDFVACPDDASAVDLDCTRRLGILPQILMTLTAARRAAKVQLAKATDSNERAVFNCRQLQLKLAANSCYGVTGAQVGRLSMPVIAAAVTSYGRSMIALTKRIVETDFGGSVKYGDTDSVMVDFGIRLPAERELEEFMVRESVLAEVRQLFEMIDFPELESRLRDFAARRPTLPPRRTNLAVDGTLAWRREYNKDVDSCAYTLSSIIVPMQRAKHRSLEWIIQLGAKERVQTVYAKALRDAVECDQIVRTATISKRACIAVTEQLPPPARLAFEKVFSRWLLVSKKRYADIRWLEEPSGAMQSKNAISKSGLEDKRRDSCHLVKITMDRALESVMLRDDILGAISIVQNTIGRLLAREVPLDELIITSGYIRREADYFGKQKHTEVVRKMRQRDPASAPRLGERVPFVMVQKDKKAKGYERAEDPLYVLTHAVPISVTYYLENQLRKPILRIMRSLVPNPEMIFDRVSTPEEILEGKPIGKVKRPRGVDSSNADQPPRKKLKANGIPRSVDAPPSRVPGSIGCFLVRTGQPCLRCGCIVPVDGVDKIAPALCATCRSGAKGGRRLEKQRALITATISELEAKLHTQLNECATCERRTRGLDVEVIGIPGENCKNVFCTILYAKHMTAAALDAAKSSLSRIDRR
jgi:DNA polymerase elongation subunit (family B)